MKPVGFLLSSLLLCLVLTYTSFSQAKMLSSKRLKVIHIPIDFDVDMLYHPAWKRFREIEIGAYWSGEEAPDERHFLVRLLWSKTALYVRFETSKDEPLVVSDKPDLTKKVRGLWDRDVCEIFIAPNEAERNKYFEFEIAPTGEWIDLGITVTPTRRETDWDYASGMTSAANIGIDQIAMAIKIPWKAFGKRPKAGDVWLGNLFRCVGKDPTRGYLSWQATKTKTPSFHVPEKFGEFEFMK